MKNVSLSNYGHKWVHELTHDTDLKRFLPVDERSRVIDVYNHTILPAEETSIDPLLIKKGFLRSTYDTKNLIKRRYKQNPLEHVRWIIFEYTSLCNFDCEMCYNATVRHTTEKDIYVLKKAADASVVMGVKRFLFIGGEVSKYGRNWLDLSEHISSQGDLDVVLLSNGWFCMEEGGFNAAGKKYKDRKEYFSELKERGLTHLLFSIDGDRDSHDRSRGRDGLYDAIMGGIDEAKESGLTVRLSFLTSDHVDDSHLVGLAQKIYDFPKHTTHKNMVGHLLSDDDNIITNRIDIGNDANRKEGILDIDKGLSLMRCPGFFRPDNLTIKANGEIATCRLANVGEGYGNIHNQDFISILNSMQDSFIYKLHADNRFKEYARYIRPSVFGDRFHHPCSLRAVMTAVAKKVHDELIDPNDELEILRINTEVAKATGHRKESK
ncbi:hypothetical protein COV93_07785 [Candidatus Woesearchaeota archaeon CG11_big_fil_rev_8_21_14_0_20_43_8]|nr:MAG: hypothetical protein COV93_07785 [Candidatus Woesearchaeota archaeon CG11_big_fil_rev_8_21_14_0_20_43_8]